MKAAVPSAPANASAQGPRVLFITRKWGPAIGGMETYCERVTQELAQLCEVDVVALKGRTDGSPPAALSLLLFPFTVLRALLRKLFQAGQHPTSVHVGDMAIWPLGLLALAFFPSAQVVLSAHGTDVAYGARGGFKGGLYSRYLLLGSRLLRKASVIANSHATKTRLHAIGWNCHEVVPLATDLRAQPQADYNPKELLFAGRLVTRKGLGWFVREVLPLLPKDLRLTVIGTRWDASEDGALEHPQVDFLGGMPQAALAQRFARAALVIVPNIEPENGEYEGFGLIAPEAASAGAVVLASASGGLTDAVRDGETGFLIDAGNAPQWSHKIAQVLEWDAETRHQFIANSQEIAQSHYAWDRVAQETARVYAP